MDSVGQILATYDKGKKFQIFGFGGIPPGKQEVSHCFPINFDEKLRTHHHHHHEPNKVENLKMNYKESLKVVKLDGPTMFHPVIKHIKQMLQSL